MPDLHYRIYKTYLLRLTVKLTVNYGKELSKSFYNKERARMSTLSNFIHFLGFCLVKDKERCSVDEALVHDNYMMFLHKN